MFALSHDERRDRQREERRTFEADAHYEAYRRGVSDDRMTYERIDEAYYAGRAPESVARDIQRIDQQRREEREISQAEYYREIDMRDHERG